MRITEVGGHTQFAIEAVMVGKFGAVIESDAAAKRRRQAGELTQELARDRLGGFIRLALGQQQSGAALVGDQNRLSIPGKEHQVAFPVPRNRAAVDLSGTLVDGHSVVDMIHRIDAVAAQAATARFATREQTMPIVFLCTAMIDKAINRLMRDHAMPALSSQVSSDLLG